MLRHDTFLTVNWTRFGDGDFFSLLCGDTNVGFSGDLEGIEINGDLSSLSSLSATT